MKEEGGRRIKAVALGYEHASEGAPRVLAKGSGYIAERIMALAEEHGVQVYEDADLVEVLAALDVDMEIPESMYKAVAEVLAFVYRLNQSAKFGAI